MKFRRGQFHFMDRQSPAKPESYAVAIWVFIFSTLPARSCKAAFPNDFCNSAITRWCSTEWMGICSTDQFGTTLLAFKRNGSETGLENRGSPIALGLSQERAIARLRNG